MLMLADAVESASRTPGRSHARAHREPGPRDRRTPPARRPVRRERADAPRTADHRKEHGHVAHLDLPRTDQVSRAENGVKPLALESRYDSQNCHHHRQSRTLSPSNRRRMRGRSARDSRRRRNRRRASQRRDGRRRDHRQAARGVPGRSRADRRAELRCWSGRPRHLEGEVVVERRHGRDIGPAVPLHGRGRIAAVRDSRHAAPGRLRRRDAANRGMRKQEQMQMRSRIRRRHAHPSIRHSSIVFALCRPKKPPPS